VAAAARVAMARAFLNDPHRVWLRRWPAAADSRGTKRRDAHVLAMAERRVPFPKPKTRMKLSDGSASDHKERGEHGHWHALRGGFSTVVV
jgi:hypothetical protein